MVQRIGLIHSYYKSSNFSGENMTVDAIKSYLENAGAEVIPWTASNDDLIENRSVRLASASRQFGVSDSKAFKEWLSSIELIQVHNTFPLLGPREISHILESRIPVRKVIQNYRMSCLSGNHFKDSGNCYACSNLNRLATLPGVFYRCYQGSFLRSTVVAKHTSSIARLWKSNQTCFVAISESVANYAETQGISREKIRIIPNSVPARKFIKLNASGVFYAGRLEREKGILEILEAMETCQELPDLHIVGEGTLMKKVLDAAKRDKRVHVHGNLQGLELEQVARECSIAVVMSRWDEPFGRVAAEALSRGQTIVCTRRGGTQEMVIPGVGAFVKENGKDLANVLHLLTKTLSPGPNQISVRHWESNYSPAAALNSWKGFYHL